MNDRTSIHTVAKFIGTDGSCGLRHMKTYKIEIVQTNPPDPFRLRVYVGKIGIPYDTMNAIKKNWEFPELMK